MTVSLSVINQRARDHAFDIDAIRWADGVDSDLSFFPDDQVPLSFTEGWRTVLTDEERITANQWYACAVSEQFIFLEEHFLMPAVRAMLRQRSTRKDADLAEALEVFVVEEQKHGEMFRRLLRAVAPDWYGHSDRHFYTPGALGIRFGELCLQWPSVFVAWPWLGHILEEKTIAYHRAYERAVGAGEQLDPLHHAVHRFHFLDEARHVQLEQVLIERLWDPASTTVKELNRPLLFRALGQYTRPRDRSVSANIVRALVAKYPRLQAHEDRLLQGVKDLRANSGFQRQIYGHASLPQTFRALQSRPELHGIVVVAPDFQVVA